MKKRSVLPDSGPFTGLFTFLRKLVSKSKSRQENGSEPKQQWLRVVMNNEVDRLVGSLPVSQLSAFEISGSRLKNAGFKNYRIGDYPEFDICKDVLDEKFDVIFAEQVFEHLLYPHRAATNVYKMLKPGGCFIVSTPFLVRFHPQPEDCTRWTEVGMRHFLEDCGFPRDGIRTGSWGNRSCAIGNLFFWLPYFPILCSLKNDPYYPVVVWAVAKRI